jgi:hypothetical protein
MPPQPTWPELIEAITPYLDQPADVLCRRLAELQPDIWVAANRGTDQTRGVFTHLAKLDVDPVPWVDAALGDQVAQPRPLRQPRHRR